MSSKISTLLVLILSLNFVFCQDSTNISVYFLYGSKPAKGYKKTEFNRLGGIHGGHVTLCLDSQAIGFFPYGRLHIFPRKKNLHSMYVPMPLEDFLSDTIEEKYTSFHITISDSQYVKLKDIIHNYVSVKTPYDYAFFGLRCASATYDIMSQIGIFEKKSKFNNIFSNFYPKKFRKKMFKVAQKNNYKVISSTGSTRRKWEKD